MIICTDKELLIEVIKEEKMKLKDELKGKEYLINLYEIMERNLQVYFKM